MTIGDVIGEAWTGVATLTHSGMPLNAGVVVTGDANVRPAVVRRRHHCADGAGKVGRSVRSESAD